MAGPRVMNRKKRRMPCELQLGSRTHSGLVLDLSASGLFIQTNAKGNPGVPVGLLLSTGSGDPIPLRVEVVRKKVVPPRLLALTGGGIGVRIVEAPDAYYDFLREIGVDSKSAADGDPGSDEEAVADTDAARFRVRVAQTSGSRSRCMDVSAPDPASAAERALADLDDGWKVLDVEELA